MATLAEKIAALVELVKQLPGDADGYRSVTLGCDISDADLDALAKVGGYETRGTMSNGNPVRSVHLNFDGVHISGQRATPPVTAHAPTPEPVSAPAPKPEPTPAKLSEPEPDPPSRFSLLEVN